MARFINRETKRQAVLMYRRKDGTAKEIAATVPCAPSCISRWDKHEGFRFTPEELGMVPSQERADPAAAALAPAPARLAARQLPSGYIASLERENALLTELLALRAARKEEVDRG